MSKYMKLPDLTTKGLQREWINTVFQTHALICSCDHAIDHLNDLINQQKCHPSTAATGDTGKDPVPEDGFDEGDLETIFKEENNVLDDDG